jgi:hypothetical protein
MEGARSLKAPSRTGTVQAGVMFRMGWGKPTLTHNFPTLPTSLESNSLGFRFKYLFLKYKTMSDMQIP